MFLTISSDREPTVVEANGDRFVIGRDRSCDLVLDDEKVSRQHAYLKVLRDGRAEVHDLASSNGTFVNGTRISSPVVVGDGDRLRIGDTVLTTSTGSAGAAAPTVVHRPQPAARPTTASPRGAGRSTVFRIVQEALAKEERKLRRSVAIASVLGGLGVIAAATVGALFATGTIGGGSSEGGASVAALERSTVLVEGIDGTGKVEYIGSGSIIRRDGIILTNAHVGAPKAAGLDVQYGVGMTSNPAPAELRIALFESEAKPAKRLYFAKLLAADGYVDAAVLKIVSTLDGKPVGKLDLPTVLIGDSNKVRDGQQVTVVGYPGVGGGFERAINISRGTVSGFQRDSHIPLPRGWIKTDAAIAHGNSGGLAADADGHLIGIPSRTQCGSSLQAFSCPPGADVQGKIRPIDLALPVIRAAEAGRSWKSPYVVDSTGSERFRLVGWASGSPDSSCKYLPVQSYPSGTRSITAVFAASGFASSEDLAFVAFSGRTTARPLEAFDQNQDRWPRAGGGSSSCYWVTFGTGGEDGIYAVRAFAGPTLQPVSTLEAVKVG